MEIKEYLQIIWKWLWLVMLCAIVAGTTGYVVSTYAMSPVYRASTTLIVKVSGVTNENVSIDRTNTYDTFLANQHMTATFKELIRKSPVIDAAAQTLDMAPSQLYERVQIDVIPKTPIIKLSFEDSDPAVAAMVVNRIATVFQEISHEREWLPGRELAIVEPASAPQSPLSPKVFLNMLLAAMMGSVASLGIVFLYEYLTSDSLTESQTVGVDHPQHHSRSMDPMQAAQYQAGLRRSPSAHVAEGWMEATSLNDGSSGLAPSYMDTASLTRHSEHAARNMQDAISPPGEETPSIFTTQNVLEG